MVQHVAIVGGGLAGLACGVALADAGMRVTIVERSRELGGRARSWTDPATGDPIDLGPHVVHSEYRNMLAFLGRLGTRDRICWQPDKLITIADGRKRVVLRHRRLPPPLSLLPDLVWQSGLGLRELWSNNGPTWAAMRYGEEDVPHLDRWNALDYLRAAGVTEPMIDWFWRFAALAVMNVPLERCSAAALIRVHSMLIGHRRIHFGFPAVALNELFAPQAARIIVASGGQVLTGTEVVALRPSALVLGDGATIAADHVLDTRPPPRLEPSPYVSCYLWFDRKITRERFWGQLGALERLNTDFYDLSNIRRGWSGRPSVIASNIIYAHRAKAMSDAEIIAATEREIGAFARPGRVVHAVVNRIPMAIPCPLPGTESERPAPSASIAGDWTRTGQPCSMESAVRSGWLAAEELLRMAGRPRKLALEPRPTEGLAGLVRRARRRRAARARASRTLPTARPRPHP
jgi:15-cis-phytoene desaturase